MLFPTEKENRKDASSKGLTRRSFFKLLSFFSLSALGLKVKNKANINNFRGGNEMEGKSKVALVKTENRKQGIKKAISLLDPKKELTGKNVLLKPNFNTEDRFPASTHNDCLTQIVKELQNMDAESITLGERSGPPPTEQVFEEKGIYELTDRLGIDLVNFDKLPEEELPVQRPEESHWLDGFRVARPVLDAERVVSTCCVKTHRHGGVFTMSLKLSVGIVPREGYDYMSELHSSADMRKMIAEINQVYSPSLVVMDAMEVFTAGGPAHGERKKANLILAGKDRVALDATGVAVLKDLGAKDEIMEKDVFEQEQIKRAAELGLGATGPEEIGFLTPDKKSEEEAEGLKEILVTS